MSITEQPEHFHRTIPDSLRVGDDFEYAEWLMDIIGDIMAVFPYNGGADEAAEILALRGVLASANVEFDFPGLVYDQSKQR